MLAKWGKPKHKLKDCQMLTIWRADHGHRSFGSTPPRCSFLRFRWWLVCQFLRRNGPHPDLHLLATLISLDLTGVLFGQRRLVSVPPRKLIQHRVVVHEVLFLDTVCKYGSYIFIMCSRKNSKI